MFGETKKESIFAPALGTRQGFKRKLKKRYVKCSSTSENKRSNFFEIIFKNVLQIKKTVVHLHPLKQRVTQKHELVLGKKSLRERYVH